MRLLFEEITGKTDRYSITDSHWFPSAEDFSIVAATATVSVSRQDEDTVIVKGEILGRCNVACDRCGESYETNLLSEFVYLATTRVEDSLGLADQECSDEDALMHYLTEPVIEVNEILREQAFLAVPLKSLCREDCRGICAGCGLVLNKEPCRCKPDTSHSPFAVLEKLRKQ